MSRDVRAPYQDQFFRSRRSPHVRSLALALARALALALILAAMIGPGRPAMALEVTDVLGRTVHLDRPARKLLLGEGRFLIAISLLQPDNPLDRVAGMLNEFRQFDPTGFHRYAEAFPALETTPIFGQTSEDSVHLETALMMQPDAAIFGISGHGPQASSKAMLDTLEAAGIPVVFLDFRNAPLEHTAPSMRALGALLGLPGEGEAFAAAYERDVAAVTGRLAGYDGPKPSVVMELRVGLGESCCFTIGQGMLADLVTAAGGENIATPLLPGPTGSLNPEQVLMADPDVYVGTAIGAVSGAMAAPGRIVLGPGVSRDMGRKTLVAALDRPDVAQLSAVRNGRAYALWHHFYNTPFNAYTLQVFARWLHPELFADLDPQATLDRLLAQVKPVDLSGTYAVGVRP